MRAQLLAVVVGSTLLVHVACGGDDDAASSSSTSSSGGSSGASSSGASSSGASSSGGSSGTSSSGGSSSGDAGGDGGTGAIASCSAPARVDTLRYVNGSSPIHVVGYGNKWAVTWFQAAVPGGDGQFHAVGRFFDGAAFATQHDFGVYSYDPLNLVSDSNGHALMQRVLTNTTGERYVLDFATGTFAAGTAFTPQNTLEALAMAAIPGGGAISLYRNGSAVVADRWLPNDPTWKTTNLTGPSALAYSLRLFANAAGKAAALWITNETGGQQLAITFFDGTSTWTTPATKLYASAGGTLNSLEGVMLSNGDVLLFYTYGADAIVHTMRVHPNGTIDAPADIGNATGAATVPVSVGIDASDRITAAWLDGTKAMARRDVGAGWLAVQDLGTAQSVRIDVDRATSNVTALTYNIPTPSILGLTGTGNTWSPAVAMPGFGITNGMQLARMAGVAFDTAGHATVIAMQEAAGTGGLELTYVKCQ